MFESIQIVGRGRVGSAIAARLHERGVSVLEAGAELVLLCVPDRAIAEVARSVEPGPWIAHTSGANPLSALDPHERRFGLHPLQTFVAGGSAAQLDGSYGAVTAETDEGRAHGFALAETLGLEPFALADEARPLYHAGAPPEALVPLMRRTIENGFELTGPIARGDWGTVDAHRRAIRRVRPDLEPVYEVLAEATAR